MIGHVLFLVADAGRERDRIQMPGRTLIRLLLKKHRKRFARSGFVSRDDKILKLCGCFLSHEFVLLLDVKKEFLLSVLILPYRGNRYNINKKKCVFTHLS